MPTVLIALLFVLTPFLAIGYAPKDMEEAAFVTARIAWCTKAEHMPNGLWLPHREPDCDYQVKFEWDLIRDICELRTEKGWRTADDWTLIISGPGLKGGDAWPPGDYFFYLSKGQMNGKDWYSISWNADMEGEPTYSHAQWMLGEDYTYSKHPTQDIHIIEGHGSKIVINFECTLKRIPEPERMDLGAYYGQGATNIAMQEKANELLILHKARLRQLMEQKLKEAESDWGDPYLKHHQSDILDTIRATHTAWEAYATAQYEEIHRSYAGGTGAGLGATLEYIELQRQRIQSLKPVLK
jgi:hypothetical protein